MGHLVNKNILLISPEPWGELMVSKHHYALELANRNKVFFLNPPGHREGLGQVSDNLVVVDFVSKIRGIRMLPQLLGAKLIARDLKILEDLVQVKFDIIWNFDPSRFFDLSAIKQVLRIAHIVDLNQDFQRVRL